MITPQHLRPASRLAARATFIGAAAGALAGLAEIAWIVLFAQLTGASAGAVARGVAQTVFPRWASAPLQIPLGVVLHMGIAMALGVSIALVLRSRASKMPTPVFEAAEVVGMLVIVWAVNFLLVLPVINPGFVHLVPYGASFISKVLFGVVAAGVLQMRSTAPPGTAS